MPRPEYTTDCTARVVDLCSMRAKDHIEALYKWRACRLAEISDRARDEAQRLNESIDLRVETANQFRYCIVSLERNSACPF